MKLLILALLLILPLTGARNCPGAGSNNIAETTYAPLKASNGPFTICTWFRSNSTAQANKYLMANHATGNHWSLIYEYVNDTVEFFKDGGAGANPRTSSGISIADTSWHHICYRKDASAASAWNKFLDGTKTQISASIDFTLPTPATDGFIVGDSGGGGDPVDGKFADTVVWDVALTDEQIAALAKGIRISHAVAALPLIRWSMSGITTSEPDLTGNGHNGTVTGTTVADHAPTQTLR